MTEAWPGEGVMVNSGQFDGTPAHYTGDGKKNEAIGVVTALAGGAGHRPRGGQLPPARLADQPPALLGRADPDGLLRRVRRGARAGRRPAGPAAG